MSMRPDVSYIPYATSSKEQTVNIIKFAKFEEGDLLPESCNYTETGNKSDDDSTLPPLVSEEEMDEMSSGDVYYDEPMPTDMLEDISYGSQSHPSINRREARYKIRVCLKKRQEEFKGALLSTQNMGKGLHKLFKAVVN